MHSTIDVWTYREAVPLDASPRDVVGYGVEAQDGSIGKVDDATYEVGASYVVVDTGPWILGKKVMLPAGVIRDVDHDEEEVFVNRTKDQIKNEPEFDDSLVRDEEYRGRVGSAPITVPGAPVIATGTRLRPSPQMRGRWRSRVWVRDLHGFPIGVSI